MILFYSGSASSDHLPEVVLADSDPGVMLTYYEMYTSKGETTKRLARHIERRLLAKKQKRKKGHK